jgi:cell division protease FtsH
MVEPEPVEEIGYNEFVALVEGGEVERITIDEDGRVTGELTDETRFETVVPTALQLEGLEELLLENDVAVEAEAPTPDWWASLIWILPFFLIIGFFIWIMYRGARGQMSQIQGMGQSQAEIIDTERPDTTFDDVAGYDDVKEEVREIVDYLRDPDKFRRVGARGAGRVHLVGPPGTGKTLIWQV